jgi:hypothetical protein
MSKRILLPTDFSEPSLATIRYGLDHAQTVGGEMILLIARKRYWQQC